jgi:hypothetical protein
MRKYTRADPGCHRRGQVGWESEKRNKEYIRIPDTNFQKVDGHKIILFLFEVSDVS